MQVCVHPVYAPDTQRCSTQPGRKGSHIVLHTQLESARGPCPLTSSVARRCWPAPAAASSCATWTRSSACPARAASSSASAAASLSFRLNTSSLASCTPGRRPASGGAAWWTWRLGAPGLQVQCRLPGGVGAAARKTAGSRPQPRPTALAPGGCLCHCAPGSPRLGPAPRCGAAHGSRQSSLTGCSIVTARAEPAAMAARDL